MKNCQLTPFGDSAVSLSLSLRCLFFSLSLSVFLSVSVSASVSVSLSLWLCVCVCVCVVWRRQGVISQCLFLWWPVSIFFLTVALEASIVWHKFWTDQTQLYMLSVKNFMIQTVIFESSRSWLPQVKAANAAKLRLDQCYKDPKSNHRRDPNQIITFMAHASAMILQHCNDEPFMLHRTTFSSIKMHTVIILT